MHDRFIGGCVSCLKLIKSSLHLKKITSVRGFRVHGLLLIPGKQTVEINPDIRFTNNDEVQVTNSFSKQQYIEIIEGSN